MPRRLETLWRKPVDVFLAQDNGYYFFQPKGCLLFVTFDGVVKAMARAKIDMIGKSIQTALQQSLEGGDSDAGGAASAEKEEKKRGGDENLQKVLEGLRENPSLDEVKLWSDRVLQNVHHGKSTPQELVKLLEDYKMCYVPLWNAESSVLVGASCEISPRGTPASDEGRLMRDNIAFLGAARRELGRILNSKGQAIIVVPIYARSLLEKEVAELFVALLKKTPEPIRKSMIFELRESGKNLLSPVVKGYLQTISLLCRALIVDTGILAQPNMDNESFKVHAYGCNFNDVKLPPQEMLNLMKKYAKTYKQRGAKSYIKNLPNYLAVEMAANMGFTYVNAPSVIRPRLSCPYAARLPLADVKAQSEKK